MLSQAGDIAGTVFFINQTSLRQSVTAEHQLGRVNASIYFLAGVAGLLGAIAGGILGDLVGIRATLLLAVTGYLLGVTWLIFSPVRQLDQLPERPRPVEQLAEIVPD